MRINSYKTRKYLIAFIALLLAVSTAFGLSSCSRKGANSDTAETVSIQTPTEPEIVDDYGVGFRTDENGNLTVTSYKGADKDVSIPDEYNDQKVKTVNRSAFKGQKIKSVTMPDGLETIGDYAFALCTELDLVNIPEGVTKIGQNAFFADFALEEIEIPESMEIIEMNAFNSTGLKEIIIPANVISVGEFAFADCKELTSVEFEGSGTVVASNAFKGCGDELMIIAPKDSPVIDVAKENKINYVEI